MFTTKLSAKEHKKNPFTKSTKNRAENITTAGHLKGREQKQGISFVSTKVKTSTTTREDFSFGGCPAANLLKTPSAYVILTGSGGVHITAQAGKNTNTDISGNTTFVKRRNT